MMSTDHYDPSSHAHHHAVLEPTQHHWAAAGAALLLTKDQAEEVKSVWATAAQVLKGQDAIPVELKILLDRLLAAYHDTIRVERRHKLAYLGWTEEEYSRGYKIVDATGRELCRWSSCRSIPDIVRGFVKYPCTQEIALNLLEEMEARGTLLRDDDQDSLIEFGQHSPGGSRKRARKKQSRTVPCPEPGCTRMCRSQAELAIHRNSHTKDLKFKCKVPGCNKAFGTARSRNRHSENIKLHQQLFAQSYPSSTNLPLPFNSPPPPFSCYEGSFLPSYSGFGPYSAGLPGSMTPTDCKIFEDCKPGPYSPVGLPPNCV